jgi:NAD(P)H dehydrogenase (quinone)
MKKISIVFHSVCGNNYLIAKEFYENLKSKNMQVNLFRVKDDKFEELSNTLEIAKEYRDEIMSVEVYNFKELLDSDIIILGSPTYFGNVSAQMKVFMDEFVDYWVDAKFYGKKLFSYACAGTTEGGGDMCLNAINIFGQHMGMSAVAIPSNLVLGESFPAYGLVHYVGDNADVRPGVRIKNAIDKICDILVS